MYIHSYLLELYIYGKFLEWKCWAIDNLLDIDNENSFYWVTDAYGQQYAVPNYLTGRRINFKIAIDF